jgi:Protein of unknown function (DUF1573)
MKRIVLLGMLIAFGLTTNAQTKSKVKRTKAKATKIVTATTSVEAPKAATVDGPGMVIENEVIDYGTINHNADGNRQFKIYNNGNKPLIITSATGSCGCTVPTAPKDPIAPGASAVIGVKYATDRVGAFTKTVTVTSNAVGPNVTPVTTPAAKEGEAPTPSGKSTKVLTIKGTVLPDPTPATPAAVEPTKS